MKITLAGCIIDGNSWHHMRRMIDWPAVPRHGDSISIAGIEFTVEDAVNHDVTSGEIVVSLCRDRVDPAETDPVSGEPIRLRWWLDYYGEAGFEEVPSRTSATDPGAAP